MDTMVLKYDKAKEWLIEQAKDLLDNYDKDPDSTADTIKELLEYVNMIDNEEWGWAAIMECPMAVSGITVREVEIK